MKMLLYVSSSTVRLSSVAFIVAIKKYALSLFAHIHTQWHIDSRLWCKAQEQKNHTEQGITGTEAGDRDYIPFYTGRCCRGMK